MAFLIVDTGSGPEGSRLTANNSRLRGRGAEESCRRLNIEDVTNRCVLTISIINLDFNFNLDFGFDSNIDFGFDSNLGSVPILICFSAEVCHYNGKH